MKRLKEECNNCRHPVEGCCDKVFGDNYGHWAEISGDSHCRNWERRNEGVIQMKEVKIESLKIKLGKKEVDLSIEEARKLHEALSKMFKTDTVKEEHHHHHHSDNWYPYRHWYWEYPQPRVTWITDCGFKTTLKYTGSTALLSFDEKG